MLTDLGGRKRVAGRGQGELRSVQSQLPLRRDGVELEPKHSPPEYPAASACGEHADERERGDHGRDEVRREAPRAERADHRALEVEQVAGERCGAQRQSDVRRPRAFAARDGRREERDEAREPERRDRNAEDLRVARALDGLAASGRARDRPSRSP